MLCLYFNYRSIDSILQLQVLQSFTSLLLVLFSNSEHICHSLVSKWHGNSCGPHPILFPHFFYTVSVPSHPLTQMKMQVLWQQSLFMSCWWNVKEEEHLRHLWDMTCSLVAPSATVVTIIFVVSVVPVIMYQHIQYAGLISVNVLHSLPQPFIPRPFQHLLHWLQTHLFHRMHHRRGSQLKGIFRLLFTSVPTAVLTNSFNTCSSDVDVIFIKLQ